jgi:hypothetical protein
MNIFGWDTVSVLSITCVNRSLANDSAMLLKAFQFSGNNFGTSYQGGGDFGAWRVLSGGSGELLRLALPITSGQIRGGTAEPIDLSGIEAIVDVSLRLLPSGTKQDLVFSFGTAGRLGDAPRPDVVTPVGITGPASVIDALGDQGKELVLDGIASFLCADARALSYAFASINLVPPGAASWLAPASSSYCYIERPNPAGGAPVGYLAILSVITRRPIGQLSRTVDPELLVGDTAFAIAGDVFLAHVIQPTLPALFGGAAASDCFVFDAASHAIKQAKAFDIASVKEGLIRYDPRVTALSVTVVGGSVAMSIDGDCDLKAGISMTFWLRNQSRLIFDATTARVAFSADPRPQSGHQADVPWWFYGGGLLVEEITELVVKVIADGIASDLGERLGSVGLAAIAGQSVRWQGMSAFDVTGARLDGAFMISGKPT